MKITSIVSLIIFSLFTSSCKSTSENTSLENLLPLKVGNLWLYQTKIYNDSGIATKISTDTIRVDFVKNINGNQWFKLYQSNFLALGDFFENRNDGLWSFNSTKNKPSLPYKFPSITADSYIVEVIDTSYGSNSWSHSETTDSIVAVKENVTTFAGSFVCYHYILNFDYKEQAGDHGTGTFYSYDVYFAPNIGIIKFTVPMSVYDGNPKGFYTTSELKNYYLK